MFPLRPLPLRPLRDRQQHPSVIVGFPVIDTERFRINVCFKVVRLNRNVSTLDAPLEQRPEVFHPIRVNRPANISLGMVNEVVNEGN